MKKLCVIGSLNTDLVAVIERFPKPGETIGGKDFATYPGGKGANQAVALGRLGADVQMTGKLGDDLYGRQYLDVLEKAGVDSRGIVIEKDTASGIAVIEVEASGENRIIIIPGANGKVDCGFIDKMLDNILEYDIFLLQLEIPLETVCHAVKLLKDHGKTVILDPAPARELPDEIFCCLDYITPNETELEILTGIQIKNEADLKAAAGTLLDKGIGTVIAKAGKRGAYLINNNNFIHSPAYDVKVVDTTAAGDSFNAGFAYALSNGLSLKECAAYANATASLSTTGK
ncbi:MAG: ribokinase, partial [Clostridiales bacterium GWC2_40_7]